MIKRVFDLMLTLSTLPLWLPIITIIAIINSRFSTHSVFFIQKRAGYKGKAFNMVKFKTMSDDKDSQGNLLPNKQRVTKLGHFLRSTSLDELPELFNIIKGDMSLVGPRPLLLEYVPLYSVNQKKRLDVKPGLTGLAQVRGRNDTTWNKRLRYDQWYVNNQSLMLDLFIIQETIKQLIQKKQVSSNSVNTLKRFHGMQNKETRRDTKHH